MVPHRTATRRRPLAPDPAAPRGIEGFWNDDHPSRSARGEPCASAETRGYA